ncbi:hypothetical protein OAO01_09415, partial [Oligoflexia bacterium]|nr:hypothetical protein [Oligoflexia bacterium]
RSEENRPGDPDTAGLERLGELIDSVEAKLPEIMRSTELPEDVRTVLAEVSESYGLMSRLLILARSEPSVAKLLQHAIGSSHTPGLSFAEAASLVKSYDPNMHRVLTGIVSAWRAKGSDDGVDIIDINRSLGERPINPTSLGWYCSQRFARDRLIHFDLKPRPPREGKCWKPSSALLHLDDEGLLAN